MNEEEKTITANEPAAENHTKPKAEKVDAKEIERRRLAEERQRAEARRKRSGDSR